MGNDNYYDINSDAFISDTLSIDMGEIYTKFLPKLSGTNILDVGCGSGRDIKNFVDMGYGVVGIEPSKKLAEYARKHTGATIYNIDIQSFSSDIRFDGIWACASLLHLSDSELKLAFAKIRKLSHDKTIIYCSFKIGNFSGMRHGRYYNDKTIESIQDLLDDLTILQYWCNLDSRKDREEGWLNLLLKPRI